MCIVIYCYTVVSSCWFSNLSVVVMVGVVDVVVDVVVVAFVCDVVAVVVVAAVRLFLFQLLFMLWLHAQC